MIAISLLSATSAWACEPTPVSAWRTQLDRAEQAYVALDGVEFEDALDGAALVLPCLAEVVPSAEAARWHGLVALQSYAAGRSNEAASSLSAARSSFEGWQPPEAWLPPGHELRALAAAPPAFVDVPKPLAAATWFDGRPSPRRPVDRPTVFQLVPTTGPVVSAYLVPSDALPLYPLAPVDVAHDGLDSVRVVPETPPPSRRRRAVAPLLASAAVAGAASVGLALAATATEERFHGDVPATWDGDRMRALQSQVNGLTIGAWAGVGLAAGLGGAGVVAAVHR